MQYYTKVNMIEITYNIEKDYFEDKEGNKYSCRKMFYCVYPSSSGCLTSEKAHAKALEELLRLGEKNKADAYEIMKLSPRQITQEDNSISYSEFIAAELYKKDKEN